MRQPESGPRRAAGDRPAGPLDRDDGQTVSVGGADPGRPDGGARAGSQDDRPDGGPAAGAPALPPGQYIPAALPVLHYGPVPAVSLDTWDLTVFGATETGLDRRWTWRQAAELPRRRIVADFHCVTRFTVPGMAWEGVPAAEILRASPPSRSVTHVLIWAAFGYSANIRIGDFAADDTLLATHAGGTVLTPEHGAPMRLVVPSLYAYKSVKWVRAIEYLVQDRRGFWEERGYHNTADPWREQRYSYQEDADEGPPL